MRTSRPAFRVTEQYCRSTAQVDFLQDMPLLLFQVRLLLLRSERGASCMGRGGDDGSDRISSL